MMRKLIKRTTNAIAWPAQSVGRAAAIALAVLAGAITLQPAGAETIRVAVDEATVKRIATPAGTVIIGNPLIADVTVQESDLLIITGKTFGVTNLIVLDDAGANIGDYHIVVRRGGVSNVTLYRGAGQVSYSCAPRCERTLTIGDDAVAFEATKKAITDKAILSREGSSAGAGGPQ